MTDTHFCHKSPAVLVNCSGLVNINLQLCANCQQMNHDYHVGLSGSEVHLLQTRVVLVTFSSDALDHFLIQNCICVSNVID